MTSTNDLSTPLLGNLPRRELELDHERDEQCREYDEEVCMEGSKAIAYDISQKESENEQSSD
jgi:hypothetical protein